MYGEAPWTFGGRAIYQLQLVPSEEARKHIPHQFKLVEAFGYTLGGFYLARYDNSPVGAFDELVVLAGLAWNAPTSCAWAARVFVSDREARDHGRAHVGLPSRVAVFQSLPELPSAAGKVPQKRNWWDFPMRNAALAAQPTQGLELRSVDPTLNLGRGLQLPVASFSMAGTPAPDALPGPRIRLALPSFSGATEQHPALLKYACDLRTNVALMPPLRVTFPLSLASSAAPSSAAQRAELEAVEPILRGRPLIALAFSNMEMTVEEPEVLHLGQGAGATAATAALSSSTVTRRK